MTKKSKSTLRSSPLSKEPYKRREESEIIRILTEIDKGLISKLGACKKYGLNCAITIDSLQIKRGFS